jgi:hypothetical protein
MKSLNIQLITAAILALGGLALLFCGVYIEPLGQIHESLLIGFGEVATFAGSIMGIDYTYKRKSNSHENYNSDPPPTERQSHHGADTSPF